MTLFDELVMDALCGPRGRFVPGMPLERLRQVHAQPATVPVPRNVPSSPKVHVAQVATKPNFRAGGVTWIPYDRRLNECHIGLPTARVAT